MARHDHPYVRCTNCNVTNKGSADACFRCDTSLDDASPFDPNGVAHQRWLKENRPSTKAPEAGAQASEGSKEAASPKPRRASKRKSSWPE